MDERCTILFQSKTIGRERDESSKLANREYGAGIGAAGSWMAGKQENEENFKC